MVLLLRPREAGIGPRVKMGPTGALDANNLNCLTLWVRLPLETGYWDLV